MVNFQTYNIYKKLYLIKIFLSMKSSLGSKVILIKAGYGSSGIRVVLEV